MSNRPELNPQSTPPHNRDLWDNLAGTADIMLGRPQGLMRVDQTSNGIILSFAALVIAGLVDASVLSMRHSGLVIQGLMGLSKPVFMVGSLLSAFLAYGLSMLMLYFICRGIDETSRYPITLALHNWASALISISLLPLSIFGVLTGTQGSTGGVVLIIFILGLFSVAGVRLLRVGLNVPPMRAFGMFALTMLLSLVADHHLRHWLGVAVVQN